jgi:hypothetical protein
VRVKRLGGPRIPVPYSPSLSSECEVTAEQVHDAAEKIVR